MLVNDPGNHVFAPRINNLRIARIKRFSIADNFGNDTIFNIKVSGKDSPSFTIVAFLI